MGPFPHDAPPAKISEENPAGTDGFEFVEFAPTGTGKAGRAFHAHGLHPGRPAQEQGDHRLAAG